MQGPPAVSVIVPAYGVAHLVGEALDSLRGQSFTGWEAIVVDDGAPDDVEGALAPFAADPRIRLLKTDNGGISVARNRAVRHARAPLIAMLDGDDLYEPDYLQAMIAAIEADPALGFVTCDATYFGEPSRDGKRFSAFAPQEPPLTLERVLKREFNIFTAVILRRAAFDAVGGYDPLLRAAEDLDLWLKLLEGGRKGGHVPRPLARYRRRAGSLSSQTLPLWRSTAAAYRASAGRLGDRPEAAIARAMQADIERQIVWQEGEAMIREGRVREGTRLLAGARASRRSFAWAVAMPLMRAMPPLAPTILAWRERFNARG